MVLPFSFIRTMALRAFLASFSECAKASSVTCSAMRELKEYFPLKSRKLPFGLSRAKGLETMRAPRTVLASALGLIRQRRAAASTTRLLSVGEKRRSCGIRLPYPSLSALFSTFNPARSSERAIQSCTSRASALVGNLSALSEGISPNSMASRLRAHNSASFLSSIFELR